MKKQILFIVVYNYYTYPTKNTKNVLILNKQNKYIHISNVFYKEQLFS